MKEDGTIKISRLTNKSLEAVVIPQQIDGKPVTEIEDYAFEKCSSMTSVTIPVGVAEIGKSTFCGCSSLTTITVQAGSYAEEWAKQEGYSVQII